MQQTRFSSLFWVVAIAVPIGWIIARIVENTTDELPPVPWVLPALMLALAVVLEIARRAVHAWVNDREYDDRLDALRVARLLVLAKASAVFGAALAGAYLGLVLLAFDTWASSEGRNRTILGGLVVVAGLAVIVSGVRCELACRVPPPSDDSG